MKKLIIMAFAAVAMLFGFASCSGDLHDVPDPNKMEGNWFYYELDTSTATSDTINIIFNDGVNYQTSDITGIPKTGSIHYLWAAATKTDTAIVSLRDDNPDKGFGKDKLGVYVFTNASKCMLWAWDSGANFTGGNWPGVAMASDTAEALPTYFVDSIKTEAIGTPGYIAFCEGWLPDNQWDATTPNKVTKAEADGSYVLTFKEPVKQDYVDGRSLKIQILNPASDDAFCDNKVGGGTLEAEVPSTIVGKHAFLEVSVGEDDAGPFAEAVLKAIE